MPQFIESYCQVFGAIRCETSSNSELVLMAGIGLAVVFVILWLGSRIMAGFVG